MTSSTSKLFGFLLDALDDESAEHFAQLKALLDAAGVAYKVNPRLVRGLDYYNRTVFEWVTDALGSQGAVCSGGRYDGLVEKLGGRATPAVGWAMGMERFIATDMSRVRIIPAAPTSAPPIMSAWLPIVNPAMAAAMPENELSSEMTTGMSAPPMGSTAVTPSSRARAVAAQ